MLRGMLRRIGLGGAARRGGADLPRIERERAGHLMRIDHGLPQVDWGLAEAWIANTEREQVARDRLKRAVAAAWLDELRDSLEDDHRRWRSEAVEGLGPLEGDLAVRAAWGADVALRVIQKAMRKLRGDEPIEPVGIVALRRTADYYSFISHSMPDGAFGTSGGVYINDGVESFPVIAMPMDLKWAVEQTIAHELTHHALHGLGLPLWVEEGLTQMMEERVTGRAGFVMSREMVERHRGHWGDADGIALERYWSGAAFSSPEDDEQELAYHLSQVLVRRMLEERAEAFFAFGRACRTLGAEAAAEQELGESLTGLADSLIGRA